MISSVNVFDINSIYSAANESAGLEQAQRSVENTTGQSFADGLSESDRSNENRLRSECKKLDFACRQFESLFLHNMIKQMRKNIPENDFINGGQAEDIFQDMLDSEYSVRWSDTKSLGMGEMLYDQLSENVIYDKKYAATLGVDRARAIADDVWRRNDLAGSTTGLSMQI